ncbi:MAG: HK97-gp10 family putative phage morphogenesis protein [Pseudonocardiaceae bacterium]
MSVTLTGETELSAKMLKLGAKAEDIAHSAADKWADAVQESASRRAPKLTGALGVSIHTNVVGHDAEVIADAPNERGHSYATYVELGTGHGPAQPYLYPAFTEHRDVTPYVEAELAKAVEL